MNGMGAIVNNSTLTGPENIRTMFGKTFLQDVLSETSQAVPFDLNDLAFGRTSSNIDLSKLNAIF